MTERLLTVDQVAELVQLGPESVRRATRRGDLRASRIGGRLRIEPAAVDEWVEAQRVAVSTSPALPRRAAALPRTPNVGSLDDQMRQHGLLA